MPYIDYDEGFAYDGYGNATAQEAAYQHALGIRCSFDCAACDCGYEDYELTAADILWEASFRFAKRLARGDRPLRHQAPRALPIDPWGTASAAWIDDEPPF